MVAIGFALLGVGLADPVLLSRINGERAEGGSGRFIKVDAEGGSDPFVKADVVRLPPRSGGDRHEPKAA
jgi:hypothetical protein